MSSPFDIPEGLPDNVFHWTKNHVIMFLKHNQERSDLDDEDIEALKENKIKGSFSLTLTQKQLTQAPYNLKIGAANTITELLNGLKSTQVSGGL